MSRSASRCLSSAAWLAGTACGAVPGGSVRAGDRGRPRHQDLAGHPQVDPGGYRVGGVLADPGPPGPAGRGP
ncbi:MAG TPA: hypothetical protein VF951_11470, partial [Streptosporangiaceae bacterium]